MVEINRALDSLKPKTTVEKAEPSMPATPVPGQQSSQETPAGKKARRTQSEEIMLLFQTRVVSSWSGAELTAVGV